MEAAGDLAVIRLDTAALGSAFSREHSTDPFGRDGAVSGRLLGKKR